MDWTQKNPDAQMDDAILIIPQMIYFGGIKNAVRRRFGEPPRQATPWTDREHCDPLGAISIIYLTMNNNLPMTAMQKGLVLCPSTD